MPASGHGAIGGDVLPAIGQRGRDVGRPNGVTDKCAGLEQVGMPGAAARDTEIGAAAGQRKTGNRERREAIVRADRGAVDARGRGVASRAVALPSVVCEPPKPAAHTLQRGSKVCAGGALVNIA